MGGIMKSTFIGMTLAMALALGGCNSGDGVWVTSLQTRGTTNVTVITVTSDAKPGKTYLVQFAVDTVTQQATKLIYSGSSSGVLEYPLAKLKTGLVLMKEGSRDVVVLESQ